MTKIEWTQATWNPTVGCSRVSPGCDGCYAIGVAHRGMQEAHVGLTVKRLGERVDWTGEVRCLPDRLDVPLRRKKPTTWFVDSMSDLFHPSVPDEFIGRVFDVMMRTSDDPGHVFQVLTKRPQRMRSFVDAWLGDSWAQWISGLWLGTSIESDRYAFRANHLRATPAAVRFLSLEPLLGQLPSLDLTGIGWVIVGGESGPGARPMHPGWAREIRDRCVAAGVPFFLKQWGAWGPVATYEDVRAPNGGWRSSVDPRYAGEAFVVDGSIMARVGKKTAGRELDGRIWDEMPSA